MLKRLLWCGKLQRLRPSDSCQQSGSEFIVEPVACNAPLPAFSVDCTKLI